MGYREPFTLYARHMRDGRKVWYWRITDQHGRRMPGKSTGQTSKPAAKHYVVELLKRDLLGSPKDPSFAEYAKGWWTDDCLYVKGKRARGGFMSPGHVDNQRRILEKDLLPRFKDMRLRAIKPTDIETWVLGLNDGKLSARTINGRLTTLKCMLRQAVKRSLLEHSPAEYVERLHETPKERGILTPGEVREMFREDGISEVWPGEKGALHRALNMLAGSTGVRQGEALGLEIQHVHLEDSYIAVVQAWNRKAYGFARPKWGSIRNVVPVPSRTAGALADVIERSRFKEPEALVFNDGADARVPPHERKVQGSFYGALRAIGISETDRCRRNVTFHSWRHYANTRLRTVVPDAKLRALTGHRNEEMTQRYTHFALPDLTDLRQAQEALIG